MKVFVDSNIPMYVAGAEHPNRDPACCPRRDCPPGTRSTRG